MRLLFARLLTTVLAACAAETAAPAQGGAGGNGGAGGCHCSDGGFPNDGAGEPMGPVCDSRGSGDFFAEPGTPEALACNACIACAVAGDCADAFAAFYADPEAQKWSSCVFGSDLIQPPLTGCPDDVPETQTVDEFVACVDACSAESPDAAALYVDALSCAVCEECWVGCNAARNCM